jgi:hypothetical protein
MPPVKGPLIGLWGVVLNGESLGSVAGAGGSMFFVKPVGPDGVAGSGVAAVVTLIPGASPAPGGCLASVHSPGASLVVDLRGAKCAHRVHNSPR